MLEPCRILLITCGISLQDMCIQFFAKLCNRRVIPRALKEMCVLSLILNLFGIDFIIFESVCERYKE